MIEGLAKEQTKPMTFYLPPQLHIRLKVEAAHQQTPMNKLVLRWIEQGLKAVGA